MTFSDPKITPNITDALFKLSYYNHSVSSVKTFNEWSQIFLIANTANIVRYY